MAIQSYRELEVWKISMDLADKIYDITETFPKNEMYGLASQIRRAAVSIPSNIAEGSARSGTKELLYFINIARGSLAELETQLILSERRKYIDSDTLEQLISIANSVGKMLTRLYQSLERKLS
ncbi:MAG: four helix bundle protein [Pseudomonadota bacterium]